MIKLLILDVDGCLSDGSIIYTNDGVESKNFNVKDGLGITTWLKLGHHIAIITGRDSKIVKRRADELGIKHVYQGIKDKSKILQELVNSLDLKFYEVGAIGDDLNDYKMLQLVGRSFTPNNGVKEIKESVDTVLSLDGGDGVVREMIDVLIDENDQREQFISIWV